MAKKKHLSQFEQQKLQKLQKVQHRNAFMGKLKTLCTQIGDESLFHLIPEQEKDTIYSLRGAPLKIMIAKGAKIQKRLMEVLAQTIKKQLLFMQMEVVKGNGRMMNYADYFLVGMPLGVSLKSEYSIYDKLPFAKFQEEKESHDDTYCTGIEDLCSTTCLVFDDISKKYLYTFKFEIDSMVSHPESQALIDNATTPLQHLRVFNVLDFRLLQKLTIGTHPLDVKKLNIDGEVRPVIQLGIIINTHSKSEFLPFLIPMEDLHVDSPFSQLPVPVYIQQHALRRLEERIGYTTPGMGYIVLQIALSEKKITPLKGNRVLIACLIKGLKLGYLLAELVEGILVIRTFLLLTNSGTPEGNKLAQLTGLKIEDAKYLSIDNLQGLANSDIEQNETICKLFRNAGCGDILELCKKMRSEPGMTWLLDSTQPKNTISELITEYLRPDVDNEEYVEEEKGE
jgi:hypothetical protein